MISTLRSSFVRLSYPLLSILIIDGRCNGKQKQIRKVLANCTAFLFSQISHERSIYYYSFLLLLFFFLFSFNMPDAGVFFFFLSVG